VYFCAKRARFFFWTAPVWPVGQHTPSKGRKRKEAAKNSACVPKIPKGTQIPPTANRLASDGVGALSLL